MVCTGATAGAWLKNVRRTSKAMPSKEELRRAEQSGEPVGGCRHGRWHGRNGETCRRSGEVDGGQVDGASGVIVTSAAAGSFGIGRGTAAAIDSKTFTPSAVRGWIGPDQ